MTARTQEGNSQALTAICLAFVAVPLGTTIVTTILPSLVNELGATTAQLQWIINAQALTYASFMITAGSLGDRIGRRRMLRIGALTVVAGSIGSGLASSPEVLIAFRAVTGLGCAALSPAALSLIMNLYTEPAARGRAIGVWSSMGAAGMSFAPIVGSVLLDQVWWGAGFLFVAVVGGTGFLLGIGRIPESRDPKPPKVDPIGVMLSILMLSTLVGTCIQAPAKGWTSPLVIGGFVLGAAACAAFVWWERFVDHPMFDIRVFTNRTFTVGSVALAIHYFSLGGLMFTVAQFLRFALGLSVLETGLALTPLALSLVISGLLGPRLSERFGARRVVASGLTCSATGFTLFAVLSVGASYWSALIGTVVFGLGHGVAQVPGTNAILGTLERDRAGVGAAMNNAVRFVGVSVGTAVIGSLLSTLYRSHLVDSAADLVPRATLARAEDSAGTALEIARDLPRNGRAFADAARESFASSMRVTLVVSALFCLAAAHLVRTKLPDRVRGAANPSPPSPATVSPQAAGPMARA